MAAFNRFRLFHWLLAGFFVAVYMSGSSAELLHIWLGYGLLVLLVLRLLISGIHLRGFPRLLPSKRQLRRPDITALGMWLTSAALASFAIATLIGLGMVDNGDVLAALPGVQPGLFGAASDIDFVDWMGDTEGVHQFFADLGLGLVGLHIAYLLVFRRRSIGPMLKGLAKTPKGAALRSQSLPEAGEFVRLQVISRQAETLDTCSYVLQVPGVQRSRFLARPGQFLTLRVPCDESALLRCYSLSQPVGTDGLLRITIKRVAAGRASNWLFEHLEPGDTIEALPPAGLFVPHSLDADLLLLGAGSGITPLMAIIEAALAQGSARVCLFYANRDPESVIFAERLAVLQRDYPQRFDLRQWFDVSQGRADAQQIATQLIDWSRADCFICGPRAFMDTARTALGLLAISDMRIHLERFGAAPGGAARSGGSIRLQVTLAGRMHELQVAPGEVLLEAMEQAGLQPPSACRSGVCAACTCRVVSGSVILRSNQVLTEQQLRQGWTLACQAEPSSAELRVEY